MKRCAHFYVALLVLLTLVSSADARRGNPSSGSSVDLQFYLVDSDDDHPKAPQFTFVDTVYNYGQWVRITGFANTDDASVAYTNSKFNFQISPATYSLFDGVISTNGTASLRVPGNVSFSWHSPMNRVLPLNNMVDTFAMFAPLWADWELRTAGDSTKIFARITNDSAYISYYNLALKGTNGNIRATFQIAISRADSSVTYQYRSFDGTYAGITAEEIIQRVATIGIQGVASVGTMYLHKGHYYATTAGSAMYAKDLHDGLAIKFFRIKNHLVSARAITFPTTERQELAQNNFTFSGAATNWTSDEEMVYYDFSVRNVSTGLTITTKYDSLITYSNLPSFYSGPTYQGLPCGEYQATLSVRMPKYGSDTWLHDNTVRRTFYVLSSSLNFPFYEQFNSGLSGCTWASIGAEVLPSDEVMYFPVAPRTGSDGALVMDRRDLAGKRYTNPFASDTLTSAPINMSGKQDVYLTFSYQRGLKGDESEAGSQKYTQHGPEMQVTQTSGGGGIVEHADTLLVEGLLASGSKWNPSAASWTVLHTITGGLDRTTNKVRVKLPSSVISDHFRLRFRLQSREHGSWIGYPHDDNDAWVIDGIQISSPKNGETEFEVTHIDLGNRYYTTVPRDVKFIRPRVTISNNGRNAGLGTFVVRLIIRDQLNREVYHKSQSFAFPNSFADTVITMQDWDIRGSQGGTFTARTYFEHNFSELYRANDTGLVQRSFSIHDVYALDDGQPDTVSTLTAAPLEWYYKFVPLTSDSLRGVDLYFLGPQSGTSWTMEFRRQGNLIGTRQFSVAPEGRGWMRKTFAPIYLPGDTIEIHVTQTLGNPIGGDASKGLIWTRSLDSTFTVFYPEIINQFALKDRAIYYGGQTTMNNGGVLLPMARLVYSGASQFLPVELVSFSGDRVGEDVELRWRTAKEENSRAFTIERFEDDSWSRVADVAAKNARQGAMYSTADAYAPASALRYRLIEHDLDGTSRVIGHVNVGALGESNTLTFDVYPNPAQHTINLRLNGAMPEKVSVRDMMGRVVMTAFGKSELDLVELSPGTYFVTVEANGQQMIRSFVIDR
jgi:hypothetical protein